MPTLKYVGNANRYRLTNSDVDVAQGETVNVDEDTAEHLLEHGEFEEVDGDGENTDAGEQEIAGAAPVDPSDYTVSELEAEIDDGDYTDAELAAIREAEASGQNRTGVRGAIDARLED